MGEGPEPNGWELLRGIKDLRDDVSKLGTGMVPMALYLTLVDRVSQLEKEQTEARKTKAQQWFAIGLALLGLVTTVIAGVIVFNVNRGGGA